MLGGEDGAEADGTGEGSCTYLCLRCSQVWGVSQWGPTQSPLPFPQDRSLEISRPSASALANVASHAYALSPVAAHAWELARAAAHSCALTPGPVGAGPCLWGGEKGI